jgi:putative phosphotransacetylase
MLKKILVETSARHIHISLAHLEQLVGKGSQLKFVRPLSQAGQFVSDVRLQIIGPKKDFQNVVVLGPLRKATQVEISSSDARVLGLHPPIRESGELKGSAPVVIKGPAGEIHLDEGLIIAQRHIHMKPDDAAYYKVKDQQLVSVQIPSEHRRLIFEDVVVRVREDFNLAMHIDTDEANAAGISGDVHGVLVVPPQLHEL